MNNPHRGWGFSKKHQKVLEDGEDSLAAQGSQRVSCLFLHSAPPMRGMQAWSINVAKSRGGAMEADSIKLPAGKKRVDMDKECTPHLQESGRTRQRNALERSTVDD